MLNFLLAKINVSRVMKYYVYFVSVYNDETNIRNKLWKDKIQVWNYGGTCTSKTWVSNKMQKLSQCEYLVVQNTENVRPENVLSKVIMVWVKF